MVNSIIEVSRGREPNSEITEFAEFGFGTMSKRDSAEFGNFFYGPNSAVIRKRNFWLYPREKGDRIRPNPGFFSSPNSGIRDSGLLKVIRPNSVTSSSLPNSAEFGSRPLVLLLKLFSIQTI